MEILNKPIEMISFCGTDGDLRPLRFRYEDDAHHTRVVRIGEILSTKLSTQVGLESYLFLCRAFMEGREQMFELRYGVKAHHWVLYRVLF